MFIETIDRKQNTSTNLVLEVKTADLDFPVTRKQMEQLLTSHALECRACLEAVLFQAGQLTETGCDDYKTLFARIVREAEIHARVDETEHVSDDAIEEYCFRRLTPETSEAFEHHVATCVQCERRLEDQFDFIRAIRVALAKPPGKRNADAVIRVSIPQTGFDLQHSYKLEELV